MCSEYQKSYLFLFNSVTDALQELEQQNFGQGKAILLQAQQAAEALFIAAAECGEAGGAKAVLAE